MQPSSYSIIARFCGLCFPIKLCPLTVAVVLVLAWVVGSVSVVVVFAVAVMFGSVVDCRAM